MKVPNKYIVLDTETGGIPEETSLLTAYFGVFDEYFELRDELDLKIKPDSGMYVVEAGGLRVNGIDLIAHDAEADTQKEAASQIYDFLFRNRIESDKLIPVGHNVHFDIEKVVKNTLTKKSWENFVGYRKIDTATIARFLMDAGHMPKHLNASLGTLCEYFGIQFAAHTAKGDALATMEVYRQMRQLAEKK